MYFKIQNELKLLLDLNIQMEKEKFQLDQDTIFYHVKKRRPQTSDRNWIRGF